MPHLFVERGRVLRIEYKPASKSKFSHSYYCTYSVHLDEGGRSVHIGYVSRIYEGITTGWWQAYVGNHAGHISDRPTRKKATELLIEYYYEPYPLVGPITQEDLNITKEW